MICFPNAKINLGLNIINKRTDGFHDIESILFPIPLFDVLEFRESKTFSIEVLRVTDNIPTQENTIYKTWRKLKENFLLPAFEIKLLKNIPASAGLGGSSADASFFLKEINKYYTLGLSHEVMQEFIVEIGSDCPFFINNKPSIARSKGEILSPIEINLKGNYLSLIKPKISVSTNKAYDLSKPRIPEISIKEIISQDISQWCNTLKNDFEDVIEPLFPNLNKLKKSIYYLGADYVSLSGSGSTIFAISKMPLDLSSYEDFDFCWQGLI